MAKVLRLKSKLKAKGQEKSDAVTVRLPSVPSEASDDMGDYTTLLYGVKKIGKTSMCQYFDMAFFIMLEPGAKALSVYQTCDEDGRPRVVKTWAEFKQWVVLLEKEKRFKTIIVDTVDRLFKLCERHVCQKLAISHPSEEEWGKGWGAIRDEFDEWVLGRLMGMGKGVVFISHAKEAEIKTRVGDVYHKITSTMSNQAKEAIEGVVDLWCHYNYDGKDRILTIGGDDHVDAGQRVEEHFWYKDSDERVRDIPMGSSSKEAYENLVLAFQNRLEQPKKEAGKPKLSLKIKRK